MAQSINPVTNSAIKIMTIQEIYAQFESEWILVEKPETNKTLEVQAGRVLFHSKDRDEVYRKAIAAHSKEFAILFTGSIPDDTAVIL